MEYFKKITNQSSLKQTFKIKKEGKYLFFILNSSGMFEFSLQAEKCSVLILGLFVGVKSQNYEIKTVQRHKKGNSMSNLLIKSVLKDRARFKYEGLIRIEKMAQKSHAYQKNENILLSDKASVFSEPFLEIMANDVYCTHGSTTGQLDKEKIFYLKTRKIPGQEARKLLVEGFCRDLTSQIKSEFKDDNIIKEVSYLIEKEIEKI